MAKVIFLVLICFTSYSALSLERCNYQLVPEFFKVAINFYTEDEKLEQKGYFTDLTLKGSLYGNSIRGIIKNMEVFIPFNNLNTYNTSRDRIIYNHLISADVEKKGQIHVKVKSLEKKRVKLQVTLGQISKEIIFRYDSRDVSMQSIGYTGRVHF